jgi:hypothetical protein
VQRRTPVFVFVVVCFLAITREPPDNPDYDRSAIPQGPPLKINLQKVKVFHPEKQPSFPPRFTTHLTTNSPSKNHVQHPTFSKTPIKKTPVNQ